MKKQTKGEFFELTMDNSPVPKQEFGEKDGIEDHTIRPLRESLRKLVGPDGRIQPSAPKTKKEK